MNALFYRIVWLLGYPILRLVSAPLILHAERARRPGGYLLAANHEGPFDVVLLMAATPRVIYWLSIVELFRHPLSRWFLTALGASPLDRGRVDTRTVRTVVGHLRAGRVVGIFPEGAIRPEAGSVLRGGPLDDGLARMARLAGVPVVPCVVMGGNAFRRWPRWLPLARTRWAVAFGWPVETADQGAGDEEHGPGAVTREIAVALRGLAAELAARGYGTGPAAGTPHAD